VKQYRPHLFVLCVLAAVLLTGAHSALQNTLSDMRFKWFPRQASGDIVLVAIDSPSIDTIGVWPWPRRTHAELLGKLVTAAASDIVFDVDFSSPSDSDSDQSFSDALQRAGGSVVLPSFQQLVGDRGGGNIIHVNRPLPPFSQHSWSALVNVAVEPDGLVRRYSFGGILDGRFMPSVAALLAGKSERDEGSFLIDFGIRADSVPTVSYMDVLHGNYAALKKLEGKKIIIGGTAIELGDRFNVPNGRVISGALLQALATESILQGRVLRTSSNVVTLGGLSILALLMAVLWRRRSANLRVAVLIGFAAIAEGGAVLLQVKQPFILDTSLYHVAVAAYLAAMTLDEIDFRGLLGRIAERRFHQIAMSLGDGLVCVDRNGTITVWNPGAAAIFGYEREEMIGQPLDRISAAPFSILDLPREALQVSGGKVMELEGRRKNGEAFPLEVCFSGWHGSDGFQFGAILRDISVRKRELERIRYLAEYDTLTGLANRIALHEHLAARFAEAMAEQCELALLVLGLDKFKEINDTHGPDCGDEVLCAVAKRLSSLIEGGELVARLGSDEFAIVIKGVDLAKRAENLCERISVAFSKIALSGGARQLRITCSIGVAIYPKDCDSTDQLLGNADLALYRAKATGRGKHVFFDRGIRDELEARLSLEAELERAVESGEFELFYQPQIDLVNGRLVGAEALIRWRHPDRGVVPPADFMPVVHASSMSDVMARWVLETACRQGCLWQQNGHGIRVAVNLSPSQMDDLATTVTTVLRDTGFLPALLELEITEDILLRDDERVLEIFREIQNLGVNIAFDDFGTGYASLSYLKKFSFDRLKIDRTFVQELRVDSDDAAIVASTISLSKLLGLTVIAEGIEDRATVDLLLSMGCNEGQGYYFSRPIPTAEFEQKFLSNDALLTSKLSAAKSAATAA
jgi:diguanylate cyclase (GGDEF)-like protein/PAS domain S-box-containing protein